MKKSVWIRLWGWAAVFLWGFGVLVLVDIKSLPNTPGLGLLLMLLYGFGVVCFVVWVLGSLFWHAIGRPRAQQAASARGMLAGLHGAGGPVARASFQQADGGTAQPPSPASNTVADVLLRGHHTAWAPAKLACGVCGVGAADFFCNVHGAPVCVSHVATHDTPWCVYVPAARVKVVSSVPAAREQKAAGGVITLDM